MYASPAVAIASMMMFRRCCQQSPRYTLYFASRSSSVRSRSPRASTLGAPGLESARLSDGAWAPCRPLRSFAPRGERERERERERRERERREFKEAQELEALKRAFKRMDKKALVRRSFGNKSLLEDVFREIEIMKLLGTPTEREMRAMRALGLRAPSAFSARARVLTACAACSRARRACAGARRWWARGCMRWW